MNSYIFHKDLIASKNIKDKFITKLKNGKFTREENEKSHFCVYFAFFDPNLKEFFLGHHKKSNMWLFGGGHVDINETPLETLKREILEEMGEITQPVSKDLKPNFLSITPINNPRVQTCREHFDIWYFLKVEKQKFNPDQKCLSQEFHENCWMRLVEAKKNVTNSNTKDAIAHMSDI